MALPEIEHSVRITVAQPLVELGDVRANIEGMTPMVEAAAREGSRLVVFSECGLTGYDKRGLALEAAFSSDDPCLEEVSALARAHGLALLTGFYERGEEDIFNAALFVHPDGSRELYRKHHIVGYERDHTPVRGALREARAFPVEGMRLGAQICSDGGAPGFRNELAALGCDAVAALTAGVGEAEAAFRLPDLGDSERRRQYLDKQEAVCFPRGAVESALATGMGLVAVNQAGWDPQKGYFQPGHSMVVDHTGEITALIPGQFAPELMRPRHATGFLTPRDA
jgi:predicted amidohydrolase